MRLPGLWIKYMNGAFARTKCDLVARRKAVAIAEHGHDFLVPMAGENQGFRSSRLYH